MYHVLMPIDEREAHVRAQTQMLTDLLEEVPNAGESVRVTVMRVFGSEKLASETSALRTKRGQEVRDRLEDRDVTVAGESRSGDPAEEILGAESDFDPDLVLVGGRDRSPAGKVIFGSVTQSVILDADCPVTVTGGETESDT